MSKFRKSKCPATVGFRQDGKAVIVYCGQWSCERCAKKLAKKWSKRVLIHLDIRIAETGEPWAFLTLTLGSGHTEVDKAYASLRKLWDRLRKALTRSNGKFEYAAFVEGQPKRRFMPHFHVLLSIFPSECLNKNGEIVKHRVHEYALRHGFGFEATLTDVTSHKAALYVAKYASKGSDQVPKNFRRVRTSQGWTKLPKGQALIMPSGGESVADYIDRVSAKTGLPHEGLYDKYAKVIAEFNQLQEKK